MQGGVGQGGAGQGSNEEWNPIGKANTDFNIAHKNADIDDSENASHHTLGLGRYQAAPGVIVGQLKAQLLDLVGEVKVWILETAPAHYLFCDGQSVSVTAYPELFNVIGYNFGGSGGNFKLPDARDRFLVGANGDIGESEGVDDPAYRFIINSHPHDHPVGSAGNTATSATSSSAGDHSHTVTAGVNTSSAGSHSHITGGPSGTVQVGSANEQAVGGSAHTHGVSSDGSHTHGVSISTSTGPSLLHSHTTTIPSTVHSHTVTTTNNTITHSHIKLGLIIRYESGLTI